MGTEFRTLTQNPWQPLKMPVSGFIYSISRILNMIKNIANTIFEAAKVIAVIAEKLLAGIDSLVSDLLILVDEIEGQITALIRIIAAQGMHCLFASPKAYANVDELLEKMTVSFPSAGTAILNWNIYCTPFIK